MNTANMIVKKIADGYNEGKLTWAVVIESVYGDEIVETGFPTKKAALAWIAQATKA